MKYKVITILFLCLVNLYGQDKLRIGILAYGTVNWEIDVLKHNKLDNKNGFDLEVVELASKNAQAVALQSGDVDIIVTDWIWVNSQRATGKDFTFYPYSKSIGTLNITANSKAKTLLDLKGKQLGIAGGVYDKSWLLYRAYSKRKYNIDLKDIVEPVYASSPILYQKMLDNSLEASINFWHFNAMLEPKGVKPLVDVDELLSGLELDKDVSFVGWTFNRNFALKNKQLINSFLDATLQSKKILNSDNQEWNRIRKDMNASDDETFEALKTGYKKGIIKEFSQQNIDNLTKVFKILLEEGGSNFVGESTSLNDETFWKYNPKLDW